MSGCCHYSNKILNQRDWDDQVRTINEVLVNQGNLEKIPVFIADSYVAHGVGQRLHGREIVHDFIPALKTAFPDLEEETKVLAVDGDFVSYIRRHPVLL